jgi:probable phosphoglycerate mutase
MTTFLLVRHGETDAVGKLIMGWRPGWHLNEKGREEVKALAIRLERMPIRAVYTSPLERAVETAEEIARPHGLEPRIVDEFGEFRPGDWEGMTLTELDRRDDWRRFQSARSLTRAPRGEIAVEMQTRFVAQVAALADRHREEMVVAVSHADPLRAGLAYYLGMPLDMILRFEVHTASVSVLQLTDRGARILCVNHRGAIPVEGRG